MRWLLALALLAACGGGGGSTPPADETLPDPVAEDIDGLPPPANELQRRQYAICNQLIPKLVDCAVEDARRHFTPEEFEKEMIEERARHQTKEQRTTCKTSYLSSRQVRVYEVCFAEERECEPLAACLDHAKPEKE